VGNNAFVFSYFFNIYLDNTLRKSFTDQTVVLGVSFLGEGINPLALEFLQTVAADTPNKAITIGNLTFAESGSLSNIDNDEFIVFSF
jgi:hypothetical protein